MTDASNHDKDAFAQPLRRWFLLLLLAVVLLHAAGLNPYWRFQRDSPLYMGLARSLAETRTYSFNGEEHLFALPGFPAMLSLVYMGFGENFLVMNALVSLLGVGCVVLGYLLYRELSLTAFQAGACVLLLALSRTLYYYSFQILTDVPFTFFAIGALYLATRMLRAQGGERWAWCVAAAGAAAAACAMRPLGPALFAAMVVALWMQPGARARWRASAAMTVVLVTPVLAAGALWAVRGAHFGAPLGTTYVERFVSGRGVAGVAGHILERSPYLIGSLSDTLLGSDFGLTVSIVLSVPIYLGLLRAARSGERLLLTFGAIYFVAICLSGPGRRYMLPALPVLVYWLVLGAGEVASFLERRRGTPAARLLRVGQVLLALAVLANLVRVSEIIREARSPDFYAATENGRMVDYFPLAKWLHDNVGPGDRVLTCEANVLHYFSRMRTVQSPSTLQGRSSRYQAFIIREEAVTYVVVDPGRADSAEGLHRLLATRPEAFEKVRNFGKLELFRVQPGEV